MCRHINMKRKVKIAIAVSVPLACAGLGAALLLLRKRGCKGCSMACGLSCADNPKCKGTKCDDPLAVCVNDHCSIRHSCSSTGACVRDPDGPFLGPTCKCFSVDNDECVMVGNTGEFTNARQCDARDADFQCVPGTGACERVAGSTTGWRTEEECACFQCKDFTCAPTHEVDPSNGIDGVTCGECGLWACDGGDCVQTEIGGTWDDASKCRCGLCQGDTCVATTSGGAYATVSACEADQASKCKDPALGWGCDKSAGNDELCGQTLGGSSDTLDACLCWTCAGTPPGPSSGCTFNARGDGPYDTFQDCLHDETEKCGWKYKCQT
jgi:hypothetical protein